MSSLRGNRRKSSCRREILVKEREGSLRGGLDLINDGVTVNVPLNAFLGAVVVAVTHSLARNRLGFIITHVHLGM